MNIDHKIVSWIHEHLDELDWYEGAAGGSVARRNNIGIHVSMAGITLTDGLKSCRIVTPEIKKLMDTEDYIAKEVNDMVMAIRKKATDQIISRLDNPGEKERVKRELFNRLSDGGF